MSTGILQLGRAGDILNVLPLARLLEERGTRPTIVVAKAFADIVRATSYADVLEWPASELQPGAAFTWAKKEFDSLLFSQVYRPDCPQESVQRGRTYCECAYNNAGHGDAFRQGRADNILIDVRDAAREDALRRRVFQTARPKILFNTAGHSSPFPFKRDVWTAIQRRVAGTFELIDLGSVRAEKFPDLLGLYDHAAMLVTSDTATLHLAGACNLPYIAFIASRPDRWHGSYTRGNCILRTRYDHALEALSLIDQLLVRKARQTLLPPIYHVFYSFKADRAETIRRNRFAQQTWRTTYALGNWVSCPVTDEQLPRSFDDGIRTLRFVKDVLDAATASLHDDEWVCFSNTDSCFSPQLNGNLLASRQRGKMMVGQRRDFHSLDEQLLSHRHIVAGQHYCGTDLFFFPTSWWRKVRSDFPDMLLGGEAWDYVMRELLYKHGAMRTTDLVYHEWHPSVWEAPENRYSLPGQVLCRRLAREACADLGLKICPSFASVP